MAATQADFYNVFFGSDEGIEVLLAIMDYCHSLEGNPSAYSILSKIEVYEWIKEKAGVDVDVEKAMLQAAADNITMEE